MVNVLPPADESTSDAVAVVSATFDKNMNSTSAGSFTVCGSQTGKFSGTYAGGGTTSLSFDPTANFKPGEEIEVTLTQSLSSMDGAGLNQPYIYRFLFETGGSTGVFLDSQTVSGQWDAIALVAGDPAGAAPFHVRNRLFLLERLFDLDLRRLHGVANRHLGTHLEVAGHGGNLIAGDLPFLVALLHHNRVISHLQDRPRYLDTRCLFTFPGWLMPLSNKRCPGTGRYCFFPAIARQPDPQVAKAKP